MNLAGWMAIAQLAIKGDQTVRDVHKAVVVATKYVKKGARKTAHGTAAAAKKVTGN
ncbi:MAG TPA: hypothetical protein VG273_16455 [Bryobacteraceae bacterium]|jgi:hypothetical protein|nr:hypothetical protein [Bryobacteraceae bacterium]